jgi:hypothetical protein
MYHNDLKILDNLKDIGIEIIKYILNGINNLKK